MRAIAWLKVGFLEAHDLRFYLVNEMLNIWSLGVVASYIPLEYTKGRGLHW